MMNKRLFSLICALALLLSLAACGRQSKTPGTEAVNSNALRLPFNSTDSTDPYSCRSNCNLYLSELIYEALFQIGNDREPVNQLAKSYIVEDNTITVTLKDTVFSDESSLTGADVVHSFYKAKQCERYKTALAVFDAAQQKGSSVVRITLLGKNIHALNLLTFPIVSQKNNRIGSGRYALAEKDGTATLVYNKYFDGDKPHIDTISLVECTEDEKAQALFEQEKIDFYFDSLESGNAPTNAINSQKAKLNNLLFVGLNAKKGLLENKAFRAAISFALNQNALCAEALEGFAVASATPFDAQWSEIGSVVCNAVQGNARAAKEAFLEAGCSYDKMGVNLLKDEKQVNLNIIVNSANNLKIALAEQVKTQLINLGVHAKVKKMPLDEYNLTIENEKFDLYIGEVKMSADFNLDCFFTAGGGADFGIENTGVQKTYQLYKGGSASLQDFVSSFCEENPFIPIGYKCANVCLNTDLKTAGTISENIIYPQIEEWRK